ncbi:hypothetical protein HHK36_033462 [Tetracentron sinense]|uniref:Uncharacterized protein n=1 Tax=Tetracentron sinense TaxID=13715 RepID=A0A834Y506_TETSI|nr:hypothetical protein HHK36_033462 [Tetracentron sinense]
MGPRGSGEKTAPVDRNTTQGRQEDNVVLKGNYPLLQVYGDTESSPPSSAVLTERSEQSDEQTPSDISSRIMRLSGLMSDTPPSSPPLWTKYLDDEMPPSTKVRGKKGLIMWFDIDFHAEMDRYGDFDTI